MSAKYVITLATASILLASGLHGQSFKDAMTLYIDGESMTPKAPVEYISSSIRQKPGKFGKAFLIERRTVNTAIPEDFVLGDGVTVDGVTGKNKSNRMSLPADGFAAIPQTGLKENSSNFLSFTYKLAKDSDGIGKITVALAELGTETTLATLDARTDLQSAALRFFPKSDAASLKFRTENAVILDNVMVDRLIDFPNSYHAPGPARGVDVIHVNPEGVFNPARGAVSFWLKAPWFRPDGEGSGLAIFDVLTQLKQTKRFGDNFAKVLCIWASRNVKGGLESYMLDNNKGEKTAVGASFLMSEITDFPEDGWMHVAICWELKDGVLTDMITLNGRQTFTRSGNFVPHKSFARMEIGYSGGSYTNGLLDDFAMFSRPLTADEIKAIAVSDTPLSEMK